MSDEKLNELDPETKVLVTRLAELFMSAVSSAAGRPMKTLVGFGVSGGEHEVTQLTLMSNIEPDDVKQLFAELGKDLDVESAKESRDSYRISRLLEQAGGRAN